MGPRARGHAGGGGRCAVGSRRARGEPANPPFRSVTLGGRDLRSVDPGVLGAASRHRATGSPEPAQYAFPRPVNEGAAGAGPYHSFLSASCRIVLSKVRVRDQALQLAILVAELAQLPQLAHPQGPEAPPLG